MNLGSTFVLLLKKTLVKIRTFRIDEFYVFCLQLHFVCIIESIELGRTFEIIKSSLWPSVVNTCSIVSSIVSAEE